MQVANSIGASPRSAIAGPFNTTGLTAPTAVRALNCGTLSNRVTLAWTSPSDTGGVPASTLLYYAYGMPTPGDPLTSTPSNQNLSDFTTVRTRCQR